MVFVFPGVSEKKTFKIVADFGVYFPETIDGNPLDEAFRCRAICGARQTPLRQLLVRARHQDCRITMLNDKLKNSGPT